LINARDISLGSLRFGLPLLAAAALGFSILSVVEGRPRRTMLPPPIPPPQSPFQTRVAGLGIVEPESETIAIATQSGGVVKRIYVEDGDRVAAGQPLFALDDRDYIAALADADATVAARQAALNTVERQIQLQQAAIAQEQAKVEAALARRRLARSTRDRNAVLVREQLISRELFDNTNADDQTAAAMATAATAGLTAAQRQRDVLAAQRIEAQALLKSAAAGRQRAAIALDKSVVRAPIDATVLKVNIHVGEYAQPGVLARPLLTLGALVQLHLRVEVDESDAWRVAAQAPAIALVRGNPSLRTKLKFVRFEPMVVPKHSLNGEDDRVDTRVLEAIYSFDPSRFPARVGQELDVFIAAPPAAPEHFSAAAPQSGIEN
jgi:HlyD family secretion protein